MNYSIHQPRSVALQNCRWIKDSPLRNKCHLRKKKKRSQTNIRGHRPASIPTGPNLLIQTIVCVWSIAIARDAGIMVTITGLEIARACIQQVVQVFVAEQRELRFSRDTQLLCNFHYWRAQETLIPLHPAIWLWDLAKYACLRARVCGCGCVCVIIGTWDL